jgi:hypothetical protein
MDAQKKSAGNTPRHQIEMPQLAGLCNPVVEFIQNSAAAPCGNEGKRPEVPTWPFIWMRCIVLK